MHNKVRVASARHNIMWNRAMAAECISSPEEQTLLKLEWDEILVNHMGVVDVPDAWFGPS